MDKAAVVVSVVEGEVVEAVAVEAVAAPEVEGAVVDEEWVAWVGQVEVVTFSYSAVAALVESSALAARKTRAST